MILYMIIFTLILLCGGAGWYGWSQPNGRPVGGMISLMGLVWLIVLILMLIGAIPTGPLTTTSAPVYPVR